MVMQLYDAHAHFIHPVLREHWSTISKDLDRIGLKYAVVNGTSPEDWPDVLQLASDDSRILPAIGLHPWKLKEAQPDWQDLFLRMLHSNNLIAIGEIGLDRSTQNATLETQLDAFRWQLDQAQIRNLPVSIHCNKAIGHLMNVLRTARLPERGIHLHAYNGPVELVPELVRLGAFFSFNAGQLKPQNRKAIERVRNIPLERLLIETDAPNSIPSPEMRTFELPPDTDRNIYTHPATLHDSYITVADVLNLTFDKLRNQIADNFNAFFLRPEF